MGNKISKNKEVSGEFGREKFRGKGARSRIELGETLKKRRGERFWKLILTQR